VQHHAHPLKEFVLLWWTKRRTDNFWAEFARGLPAGQRNLLSVCKDLTARAGTKTVSSYWCPVKGQEAPGTIRNTRNST